MHLYMEGFLANIPRIDLLHPLEINFDEIKELGLGHYQGRSGQGVRRWPLFLSAMQTLLKLIATGVLPVEMPPLNWVGFA